MENHLNSGLYELYLNQIEQRKLKDLRKQYLNELAEFNQKFFLENAEKFDTRTIATAMTHFKNFEIGKNYKALNKNTDCQP